MSTRARWLPIALALASFGVGTWVVDRAVPTDTRGNVGAVERLFAEQKDEVDVVFIGSSRFHAGIDTEAMEDEWRKAGVELRAFNYGVPGSRGLEQYYFYRKVLAQRPARLKYVVLEALPIGITIRRNTDYSRKAETISARAIDFHSTVVTRRALAAIWRFPLPAVERAELATHQLDLWGRRFWNVGLLSERNFQSLRAQRQRERKEPEERGRREAPGFGRVLGAEREEERERQLDEGLPWWETRESVRDYRDRAKRIVERNAWPVDFRDLDLGLVRARAEDAERAGVELIYLTMPCEVACPEILRLQEAGLMGPLMHYNDPERYPDLFLKRMREGIGHLNPIGAEVFGRIVARDFLALRDA